jgi:hypothetical protein
MPTGGLDAQPARDKEDVHMADPPPYPEVKPHTRPRWLKVSLIIVGAIVLLVVILALTGVLGGGHGPGQIGPGQH